MAGEFGSTNYTNGNGYTNSGKRSDNLAQRANPQPREFHDYSTQAEHTSSSGKKKRGHTLMRSLVAAAATTAAAVTILPAVTGPSVDVRFEYLNATNSVLEYVLSFDALPEDSELRIVVETPNGYVIREQPVDGEIVSGTIEDLLPGYRYEVAVKEGSSTLASRAVTMAVAKRTELSGVEYECRCALDGMFHFRLLGFLDENGYWSDFYASLEDAYGNSSSCDFSDAPSEEHTLAVNDAGMRGNRATLRITCRTTEPDEQGDRTERERVLFEAEVAI